ncbi:MAG: UDP-N-acetylglucosamine 2-epimerase (non-hydrolyzing) [Coxiellaceae bacterium]|nr:UDP-N-acetylglucosamine 2-epimerase (non-hydrolyzing) [Coxiellaceae bacterium]
MKVLSVLCTRPSAIKMAPIVHELRKHTHDIEHIVCVTGQHREMLDRVLRSFEIIPDHDLNIMSPNQDLSAITTRVLKGMQIILKQHKPNLVLVQGDTTSAMAAALAAFYEKIPVAHVEAGLRTHNIYAPFPEEMNRAVISRIAEFHFAPTLNAKKNLLQENIPDENIIVTGNTVIDALFWMREKVNAKKNYLSLFSDAIQNILVHKKKMILITGHRRENFGEGFLRICTAFRQLATQHPDWHFIYPVHLNPNVQKPVYENLSCLPNIHLIEPVDYDSFVYLMDKATLIISDSGGVQEEAPSFGKPVLVTRSVTERPEGVAAGVVILTGTDTDKIVVETESLMSDATRYEKISTIANPYGDGKASERITQFILSKIPHDNTASKKQVLAEI